MLTVAMIPVAMVRIIDNDEGYILQAARLVSEGYRPYIDFFFLHTPLVPYVYGGWFALIGRGWHSARFLCGVIAITIGLLLFEYVHRSIRSAPWAFVAVALFALSGGVLGWFTVIKTYALGALFLLAAACTLRHTSAIAALGAGVFLGLAASARIYLIVAVPCGAIYLVDRFRGEALTRRLGLFALGGFAAVSPVLYLVLVDPVAVYFGVLRFHSMREYGQSGLVSDLPQKFEALLGVLSIIRPALLGGSLQMLPLLMLAVVAVASPLTPRNSFVSYVWIAVFFASLLPTPVHPQYFALLIPFLIIDVIELVAKGSDGMKRALAVAAVAYGLIGMAEARHYTVTGEGVPGVVSLDRVSDWSITTVRAVSRLIDEQGLPVGVSSWPGYFVETRTAIHRDLVDYFSIRAAGRLTPAERAHFHVISEDEIGMMIHRRSPQLFVEGNWSPPMWGNALHASGYRPVGKTTNVTVWVAR